MSAKSEMADQEQEHQREIEGLLDSIRELRKELLFETLLVDSFIPPEFQERIEQHVSWNEEIGEWQLKFVAYTGNHMRKLSPSPDPKDKNKELAETDISDVYLSYDHINYSMGYDEPIPSRPKSSRPKSSRPKTAGRPKTGKKKKGEGEDAGNKNKEDDPEKYPQSRRLLSPKKHFA